MHPRSRRVATLSVLFWAGSLMLGLVPAHVNAWNLFTDKTVTGSGHTAMEKRELAAFQTIAIDLPCKVELIQGSSENITIEADDNLLPLIETVVSNGQLTIRATTTLDISIAGSGDIRAARLSAQNVNVSIAGSGNATLWVRKALTVSIAGSGNVQYYGEGRLQELSTTGSGKVRQLGTTPPL